MSKRTSNIDPTKPCGRCTNRGVKLTSAFDGRRKYVCLSCGEGWTEGRRHGEGYLWKRKLEGEA